MADTPLPQTNTPRHLWVIGIVSLLWNAVGAFDFLMTQTHNQAYLQGFTEEQLDYFHGFPAWVVVTWGVATWGSVLGSGLLLARKWIACPVFAAALLAMVLTTVHNFFLSDGFKIMGGTGPLIFSGVIFVIALLLVLYAQSMRRRGVLR